MKRYRLEVHGTPSWTSGANGCSLMAYILAKESDTGEWMRHADAPQVGATDAELALERRERKAAETELGTARAAAQQAREQATHDNRRMQTSLRLLGEANALRKAAEAELRTARAEVAAMTLDRDYWTEELKKATFTIAFLRGEDAHRAAAPPRK